jgi:hypothetical protein
MKSFALSLILICLCFSSSTPAVENEHDAKLIINRLLHIDNEKYKTKNEDGKYFYNSLLEHKDWERLYIKFSQLDIEDKKFTETEIKYLLFIGFVAKTNLDAAISESLSSDLVPIFNKNKIVILKVLSDLNFLIPSTCHYLNSYFGFEGKNTDIKMPFIKENKATILKLLGKDEGERCMSYFTQ